MFKIYNTSYKHNDMDIMPSMLLTHALIYHCYSALLRVNNRTSMNFKQHVNIILVTISILLMYKYYTPLYWHLPMMAICRWNIRLVHVCV
jgi:hypothetical protein